MRKWIGTITIIGFGILLFMSNGATAVEGEGASLRIKKFDESLKKICNGVMASIYEDILSIKSDHDHLVDFGPQVLSKNQYGVETIEYRHEISEGIRAGEFLEFGVTIVRPQDINFSEFRQQAFNFNFPLLNVKFAGYQRTSRKWMKFNIQDIIQRNGDPLLEEQKKYLPLKLSLKTDKETYKVGENIKVTVTLENVSTKNLWVKPLDKTTLYFLYDNVQWGTVEVGAQKRKRKFILRPGEKFHKRFVGSGAPKAQEIEIYCSYGLTFEGVKPSSTIKVNIVE